MKEYAVLEIKCNTDLKISDIYTKIKEKVKYNSNFFALQNVNFEKINNECKKIYDQLNLDKFAYKKVLEHLKNSNYYNPERDDRRMISNMDSRWEWFNERENTSLNEQEFNSLVNFCDKLNKISISSLILGLDEIEWVGEKVEKGTYGYKKADCSYDLGKNYLSNCVIVGRTYQTKSYIVCLSCEKRFRNLDVIKELVDFLGDIKTERIYFAPENDFERDEWEKTKKEAEEKFTNAIQKAEALCLENIEKHRAMDSIDEKEKINIRKYINKYLCTNGWMIRKNHPDEWPTIVSKVKGETEICISIISGDNGHRLQYICYYRSKKFFFGSHVHCLDFNYVSNADIDKYFRNAELIKNYLYENL